MALRNGESSWDFWSVKCCSKLRWPDIFYKSGMMVCLWGEKHGFVSWAPLRNGKSSWDLWFEVLEALIFTLTWQNLPSKSWSNLIYFTWKTWFCLLGHTQKWRILLGLLITKLRGLNSFYNKGLIIIILGKAHLWRKKHGFVSWVPLRNG